MSQQPVQFVTRTGARQLKVPVHGEPDEAQARAMALPLRTLIEPYRKPERLVLRVWQMPKRARFSTGQKNADDSWSLTYADLNDLQYLLPSDFQEAHTLAIRVIDKVDGAVVAVLNYDVYSSDATAHLALASRPAPTSKASDPSNDGQLRAFAEQLARTQAALKTIEADAVMRVAEAEERTQAAIDEALSKARAEWEVASSGQLEAVVAHAEQTLTSRRAEWQAQLDASIADADRRAEKAKEIWQRDTEDELVRAHEHWKADEAARLAAIETEWRTKMEVAQADARASFENSRRDSAEIARLRNELATAKTSSEERDRALAAARADLDRAREDGRILAEERVAHARQSWASEEAACLSAAEQRWRDSSHAILAEAEGRAERAERALAEAARRIEQSETAASDAEKGGNEIAALKLALAAKENELSSTSERIRRDAETRLAKARENWKREADVRFAEAEAYWRDQVAQAMNDIARKQWADPALNDAHRGVPQSADAQISALRGQIAALETALRTCEEQREKVIKDNTAALEAARRSWAATEAARLKDVETQARASSAKLLNEATRRAAVAEKRLSEERSARESNSRERVEILRLRDEVEGLKLNLDVRDAELRQLRAFRKPPVQEMTVDRPQQMRARDAAKSGEDEKRSRKLMRDVVRAVIVVFPLVFLIAFAPLLRLYIEPLLPDEWQDDIDQAFGQMQVPAPSNDALAKPQQVEAPTATAPVVEYVLHTAKLHSGASKMSSVLETLPTGTKVVYLGQGGHWVHISVDRMNGWVGVSYVGNEPAE